MGDAVVILLLSLFAGVLALAGGFVFLYNKKLSNWLACYSIGFAAGVLLTVSLMGALPEAFYALGETAFLIALVSFVGAFVFEHVFFGIHHHDDTKHGVNYESSIPLVIIGDTIHNFVDGVAIAASYFISPTLGFVVAASTFLHEVPHEVGDFGILLKAGWGRKKIIIVNILSALTAVLGALFVIFVSNNQVVVGVSLSFSAGLFLYLGASDFLPHIHDRDGKSRKSVLAFLLGVFIMLAVIYAFPSPTQDDFDRGESELEYISSDLSENKNEYK